MGKPDDLTVSQLSGLLKNTLEAEFPKVWVAGEISNLSRPQSGHLYFTLKDDDAQIRGVIWRSTAERLKFDIEEGMQVICCGGIDLYPPRGSYQLVVRSAEPLGMGPLQLAFKQLHEKLQKEGLFDPRHKKAIPPLPRFNTNGGEGSRALFGCSWALFSVFLLEAFLFEVFLSLFD